METQNFRKTSAQCDDADNALPTSKLIISRLTPEIIKNSYSGMEQFGDCYIFICSLKGSASLQIDLARHTLSQGHGLIIRPNQVFQCISATSDAMAFGVSVPQSMLMPKMLECLQMLLIDGAAFPLSPSQTNELTSIYQALEQRELSPAQQQCRGVAITFARSFAAVLAEAAILHITTLYPKAVNCLPLLASLSALLETDIHISRLPSHYASKLNISPTWLNERLRTVLGLNISYFIRRTSIVKACRMLAMTNQSIKEIAVALGYDDPAYFTRLFTKIVGQPPSTYRQAMRNTK